MKAPAKRLTVMLLTAGLLFTVCACGQEPADTEIETEIIAMTAGPEETALPAQSEDEEPEEIPEETEDIPEQEEDTPEPVNMPEAEETKSYNTDIVTIRDISDEEPEEVEITVQETPQADPVPVETYTYTDTTKTVYTTISLNVRSGPSTDFDRIGTYVNGAEVSVTGRCNETGWYRVAYNGMTGYCDSGYTSDTQPVVQSSTTSQNNNTGESDSTASTAGYSVVSAGDSGVSSYYVDQVQAGFNGIPTWVQRSFVNNGWQVKVRSGSWWYEYGWSVQLKGLTHFDNKTIYISARDDAANYHTVAHEVGHYIDGIYGSPSTSSEFSGIYNAEYRQFCSYYSYSNGYPGPEELFAESIYHYWTDPGTLANVAPQTYSFIQKTL